MELGERVWLIPSFMKDYAKAGSKKETKVGGVVTYINKKHRYAMVEFDPGYRECFKF